MTPKAGFFEREQHPTPVLPKEREQPPDGLERQVEAYWFWRAQGYSPEAAVQAARDEEMGGIP